MALVSLQYGVPVHWREGVHPSRVPVPNVLVSDPEHRVRIHKGGREGILNQFQVPISNMPVGDPEHRVKIHWAVGGSEYRVQIHCVVGGSKHRVRTPGPEGDYEHGVRIPPVFLGKDYNVAMIYV